MSAFPFDTLLIANRGEIALSIIRTAKRAGLRRVAVASRGGPCDQAPTVVSPTVVVRDPPDADRFAAYLDGAQIVEAATSSGAERDSSRLRFPVGECRRRAARSRRRRHRLRRSDA
jgi:biotin carboxylase